MVDGRLEGRDDVTVEKRSGGLDSVRDSGRLRSKWKIERWRSRADRDAGEAPYSVSEFDGNIFLNEGITAIWNLVTGASGNHFDNSNAQLGVGNSNVAAGAAQTGLQGASTCYKAMEATYPQVSGQDVSFRAEYGTAEANFAWEEYSVRYGSSEDNPNLNRKVENQGTKQEGQVWALTLTLSLS